MRRRLLARFDRRITWCRCCGSVRVLNGELCRICQDETPGYRPGAPDNTTTRK